VALEPPSTVDGVRDLLGRPGERKVRGVDGLGLVALHLQLLGYVRSMRTILERLTEAQNAHDAVRLASCFAEDYVSAQPVHPGRAFTGRAQVLANWTSVFAGVPDFRAELLASSADGDTAWGEVDWQGQHTDGSPFAMRGVIIVRVLGDPKSVHRGSALCTLSGSVGSRRDVCAQTFGVLTQGATVRQ
jgi:ketosteroid isomerase-like protein